MDMGPIDIENILTSAAIDPSRRAESLSVSEFVSLTNAFSVFKKSVSDCKVKSSPIL